MSGFFRFSCLLWDWEPFIALDMFGRNLWLGLLTSGPARRLIPGLWQGSISSMSEAARMPVDETIRSLDTLLDRELVEFDQKHRVLRYTQLPDAGEWPSSPFILKSWWGRFRMVPECAVRDAHVTTLRWMLDRGAQTAEKNVSGKPSANHEQTWAVTFGTVTIPASRRRGVRRLADSDTSTSAQPGLFSGSPNGSSEPSSSDPPARSVDKSEPNKITGRETHSSGSGEGEGVGEGDLSSSSLGDRGSTAASPRSPATEPPDLGAVGRAERERPRLALVPEPPPYTPKEMLAALSQHAPRFNAAIYDEACQDSLHATIRHIAAQGVTLEDLAFLSVWLGRGMRTTRSLDSTSICAQDATWAGGPGNVWAALQRARELEADLVRKTNDARAALRF